jgi:hypothetical protein
MKMRYPALLFSLLMVAIFTATYQGNAQRAPRGKVTSLQATSDKDGQHPATAEIAGPATIMCISVFSETPNVQPPPNCASPRQDSARF